MSTISRWLKDVRRRWGKGALASKGLPSLVRVMDDLVPRKVMREVVASSHDRRQWGVLAAAWVGVSEREFHAAAASAMGLPLEERVIAPDLVPFGVRARPLLIELRRIGAIVALDGLRVTRIVAVDPAEVRGLSMFEPRTPISLASWTEVARALDEAERMLVENEKSGEHREARRRKEVCAKILDIIIREARAHQSHSVEVVTIDGTTRYQFRTAQGKTATGAIRAEVVRDLLAYLSALEGSVIKSEAHGDVVLRSLGSASNFRLSWGAIEPLSSEMPLMAQTPPPSRELEPIQAVPALLRESVADVDAGRMAGDGDLVLVVDDNPMFCRVLERLLHREGVHPSFAENGVIALEKLKAARCALPKVIICDLHMPIMNGGELLAQLKKDSRLSAIPVIMLTSDEDIDAELQLLAGGADAFVSKAKDPRVLTTQVRRLLKRHALQEAA